MTTLAVVFLVWAIVATAFWVAERERYLSHRRLFLNERRLRRRWERMAKEERLLRIYYESRWLDAHTFATAMRQLLSRSWADALRRRGERNGHLEVVKDREPA